VTYLPDFRTIFFLYEEPFGISGEVVVSLLPFCFGQLPKRTVFTIIFRIAIPIYQQRQILSFHDSQIHSLAFKQLNSPIKPITFVSAITFPQNQKLA
jgi:hypothetical protein